jgi:Ni/Co efflux regulator RcnB
MQHGVSKVQWAALVFAGVIMASMPALADKPEWAGKGKNKKEHAERNDDDRGERGKKQKHFKDQDREYVRDYYVQETHRGHCPPGLAKKKNGCMPPGQAKKWAYGRPLPRDVVYYPVPEPVVVRIGPPPSGYRYVRVASDILMVAIGTGLVVDAIQDLGRM